MCTVIQCVELSRLLECDIQYDVFKTITIANCSNRGLTSIPKNIPSHISVLDLSLNELSEIDTNSFVNYTDLQVLNLTKNQLNSLSRKAFKGLSKLSVLDMSHNKLDLSQEYSAELFLPIQNLTTLDISNNMNQSGDVTGFNYPDHAISVLRELSFLAIDIMPTPKFGSGFSRITNLKELHFQSCYLKRLENKTFLTFSSSVEVLTLRNCLLYFVTTEVDVLLPFPNLRVIDFSGTFMHLKPALQLLNPYRYANMTTINFGRVSYPIRDSSDLPFSLTITSDIIKHLKTICVKNLDLSENGIVEYEPGSLFSFDHPECLRHLLFKGNRFVLYNLEKRDELNLFFKKAIRLKYLDYSFNAVNYNIKKSLTSNVNLGSSEASYVFLPTSLETLDISYTVLNTVPAVWLIVPENNNLTFLDISYSNTTLFMSIPNIQLTTFISAGTRYDFAWHELEKFQNSSLKKIVLKNAHINNGIRTYGNRFFKDLASVVSLDISQNDIWYFTDDLLKPMSNLACLYLTQNLLSSIPVQIIGHSYIKTLDVRNNLLTSVNSTITNWADKMEELHGMTLNLDGNAFECNCDTVDFIRWIQTTKVNLDNRSYICKLSNGTVIDTLIAYNSLYDLFADCKNTMWLTLASSLLSTFVTISLLLVVYSKRWKIIFSVYGIIRRTVEREVRKSYQYDVYMSYEGEIVIWIKDVLVPKLETEWGLTLCIKDRDFLSGTSLADTEAESIQNSRSIIFLITPESKSSRDCLFELDRAKYEKITKNLERIIVITKGITIIDIPVDFSYIWNYAYLIQWPKDPGNLDDTWRKLEILVTDGFVAN
ncbi:unnamed protein product [Mytilus coruscus]|uniref:TIR domain-containing protein n=1 Tax=Mytilus coruscus TaxID=42192 RepID=A0A6J8CH03_MYTCO|nr:unnamed protein product [Mytilus coruscus]